MLLSVVIPVYNAASYLQRCVKSVCNQTYQEIEIILVNDGSNDNSGALCDELAQKDTRIRVVHQKNSGSSAARNAGIQCAKGDYIVFLDADDYFTPEAFLAFDKYVEKDFDIVYFKTDSINLNDGTRSNRHNRINPLIQSFFTDGNEDILRYRFVNPIAKMLRTEFVIGGGFQFDEILVSNDVWFSIMTGHSAKKITADDAVVYMITAGDSGSSLTKKRTKENWFTRYKVMVKVNTFLKSIGKYQYRIILKGALRIAWKEFGFKEFLRFLKYAYDNKVGIL